MPQEKRSANGPARLGRPILLRICITSLRHRVTSGFYRNAEVIREVEDLPGALVGVVEGMLVGVVALK